MTNYTKNNPPLNQWATLVARSIHEPGSIDWLDSNMENYLRAVIHDCGYWSSIDHIFPTPCQENNWLYDEEQGNFMGFFLSEYEDLYGSWSEDFAYRSHMFQISLEDHRECYYTAADAPKFLIEKFTKAGVEVVMWDKELSKFHPLLQKAKKEAAELSPPIHTSVPTRIWNQTEPDLFWSEWEARKQKHLSKYVLKA